MRLGEPGDQLRFPVGLWPAIAEVCQIFESVSNQGRVGGERLVKSKRRNVLDILRERKFRALDVTLKNGEPGIWLSPSFPYFCPAKNAVGALSGRAEHAKTSVKNRRLELQELFYWCVSDCHVNQGAILKPRD